MAWALANPKADEREMFLGLLATEPELLARHPCQTITADKGYVSRDLDRQLGELGVRLLRPSYRNRPGQELLSPVRQLIESVNDTLKGQTALEHTEAVPPQASPSASASASSP